MIEGTLPSTCGVNVAEMETLQHQMRQSFCKQLRELEVSVWMFECQSELVQVWYVEEAVWQEPDVYGILGCTAESATDGQDCQYHTGSDLNVKFNLKPIKRRQAMR